MDINNLFETFEHSAFRLEGLPAYSIPSEQPRIKTFLQTGIVPKEQSDWMKIVSRNVAQGKKMERLRLLSEHLTNYERYELVAYSGPRVGEQIRTALRKDHEKYQQDFWFFDSKWVAWMKYDDNGKFINSEVRGATPEEIEMSDYWVGVFEKARPLAVT